MKSYELDKTVLKRHVISGAVTFATGFSIAFLTSIDDLTMDSIKNGALFGALFAASRAGFKVLLEAFVAWRAMK